MTTAYRAFAKLTPQTADLSGMPGGGEPVYPVHVVAAALAKLPRRYYLAGRLRYLQDYSVADELVDLLWIRSCDFARHGQWKLPPGKQLVRRLSRLAVAELAEPGRFRKLSMRHEDTGIPKASWYRTWQPRYQQVYDELHRWSDIAALHLKRQLRDSDS